MPSLAHKRGTRAQIDGAAAINGLRAGELYMISAAYPYISVTDGLSSDWSTKTATGREIRLAITVWDDGEEASRLHNLMGHAEEAIAAMARDLPGWRVASNVFLRSLIARDAAGPWAGLVEHRIRILSQ